MITILYVCTHNRCRSILSEAITNHLGEGKLRALSAGSAPSGEVHPLSLKYLAKNGFPTEGLRSQSWEEFSPNNHPIEIDVVITVCDQASQESCPVWMGKEVKLHWGLTDPSKEQGSEAQIAQAFQACIDEITKRVKELLALDTENPKRFREQLHTLL